MKDPKLARRMRIVGALMTAGFLSMSWKLALLAGDRLTGLLQAGSLSLLWPACILLLDHLTSVSGGELSGTEKRVLQAALLVTFGLGLSAAVLAISNAGSAAAIVAAVAGILAVGAGAFSVWLTIRFVGMAHHSLTSPDVADETLPAERSTGK